MSEGFAAFIGALRDLRVSAQVSLSVSAISGLMLGGLKLGFFGSAGPTTAFFLWLGAIGGIVFFLIGFAVDEINGRRDKNATARRDAAAFQEQVAALTNLGGQEQAKVVAYLVSSTRTGEEYSSDPQIGWLIDRKIFEEIKVSHRHSNAITVCLSDWAYKFLREHPEVVGITAGHLPPIGKAIGARSPQGPSAGASR